MSYSYRGVDAPEISNDWTEENFNGFRKSVDGAYARTASTQYSYTLLECAARYALSIASLVHRSDAESLKAALEERHPGSAYSIIDHA